MSLHEPPHHHDARAPARPAPPQQTWPSDAGDGASAPEPSSSPRWLRRVGDRLGEIWPGRSVSDASDDLWAVILDAVPDPFLLVDEGDRIRMANDAFGVAFGYTADQLIGAGLAEALIPPARHEAYRALRQSAAGDATARLAVRHADGSEVPVEAAVRVVSEEGTTMIGVRFRDGRDAKAAEEARAVAESQRQTLRTIVDAIPEAVVAVDRAGHVIFRNRASAHAPGDEAAPRGRLPEAQWRAADAVMRSGTPVFGEEEPAAEGRVRLTSRIPIRNGSGAVVGLVATARDVTAQKAGEARLVEDKQAAEATARVNSEFLATTSHEVRTLMSGVTGMTTLLLDTTLNDDQRDFVETIRTSSAALLTIVNDVLDLSKIDAGMLELESRSVDVRQVVQTSMGMLAQQAAAKGLGLASDIDDTVPAVIVGDATRLRQVLVNLITNAVKFTDEGSVRVGVQAIAGAKGAPMLAFSVRDTGVGIAPERVQAVFEPYVQADVSTARTHGGTGLGLAICRRLVAMMGGEMSVESVPGGGSVFRFTVALRMPDDTTPPAQIEPAAPAEIRMPAEPPPSAEPPAPAFSEALVEAARPQPSAPSPDLPSQSKVMAMDSILPSARVLLVEDDPVMQKVTSLTLRRLGYRPTVASDGAKAVAAVRREPFDVILMDIMMPVMDGFEATRQIRADPGPHPAPAIVALTANAMNGDRERCLDAGCDDYLTKPVAPRELASTIERAIRSRQVA